MIFIEVDGGYRERYDYMGIGVAIFESNTQILSFSKYVRKGSSSTAELLSIFWGLKLAISMNIKSANIVTDSRDSIRSLNKNIIKNNKYDNALIQNINAYRDNYKGLLLYWMNRKYTESAHDLSSLALEKYRKLNNLPGLTHNFISR